MPLFKAWRSAWSVYRLNDDVEVRSGTPLRDWSRHSVWRGGPRRCCGAASRTSAATFWRALLNVCTRRSRPLQQHGLCRQAKGHRNASQVVRTQMAAEMLCGCRQPGGSRRVVYLRPVGLQLWRTGLDVTCSWIGLQARSIFLNEKAAA
jgi:hypothetical protein